MQALENQQSFQNQQEELAFVPQAEQKPYPMKWHKWVIWVQLWISALSNLYSAYTFLNGAGYSALAYSLYPGLRAAGVFAGIGSLAVAVYTVYARFQLSRLKQGAPGKLVMLSVFALVLSFLYRMWICSVVNVSFKWSAETVVEHHVFPGGDEGQLQLLRQTQRSVCELIRICRRRRF